MLFVIEASERLGGALGVTLQQGLETVASTLESDPVTARTVYMAAIVFGETVRSSQRLTSVSRYTAPTWETGGTAALGPALEQLATTMRFGLIQGDAAQPGDLSPLVFLALGSTATDDWEPQLARLRALPAMRAASVFALISSFGEAEQARKIASNVVCLEAPGSGGGHTSTPASRAAGVTAFFDWVAQVARMITESQRHGAGALSLPPLPPGLVAVA